jgi:TM2 domain-containing membrane protein YozV
MPKSTKFCPECGTSTDGVPRVVNNPTNAVVNSDKSPGLAALLSFFIVGLGQVYIGLTKKGILLFIGALISGVLMLFIIGWITWLIVWGYAIYDAYNSAEKMRNGIAVEDTIDIDNLF